MVRSRSPVRFRTTAPSLINILSRACTIWNMPTPRKKRNPCLACGKELSRPTYKYCSNKCQWDYQYKVFIEKWKTGEIRGLRSTGIVLNPVKRYLREKYENKCCLCGWSKINSKTGKVPLVADHIDGNWQNNVEENLRLICPNCDSLSPTYAALNKGNGRKGRMISRRMTIAKSLIN